MQNSESPIEINFQNLKQIRSIIKALLEVKSLALIFKILDTAVFHIIDSSVNLKLNFIAIKLIPSFSLKVSQ